MSELHYRVTRNTATLQSYRAWRKAAWASGGGPLLTTISLLLLAIGGVLPGVALVREWPRWILTAGLTVICLGICLQAWQNLRAALYRRAHPWQPVAAAGRAASGAVSAAGHTISGTAHVS